MPRVLAIDMPDDCVRAALAERTWDSLHLEQVFEEPREHNEQDLSGALKRVIQRTGAPDIVVSALPSEFVVKRLLELPFKDLRKLSQVVPFALEEHLPFPVDDAIVAFSRVGHDGDNTLVMAALARQPDVKRHLDLLAKAEIDPKTVTLAELAVAAMLSRSETAPGAHLVLDIEEGSTSMVLMDSQGTPRAMRSVNAGVSATSNGAASAHTASIITAIRQTLLAHTSDSKPDIVLSGSGAAVPRLKTEMAETFEVPVRDATEFDFSFLLDGQKPDMRRFAGCVAMLLGELPSKPAEMLNFRQGTFAFAGASGHDFSEFRTTFRIGAAMVGLAAMALSLNIGTSLYRLHKLNAEMSAIAAPALGHHTSSDPVGALQSGIAKIEKRLTLIGAGTSAYSALDALAALSRDIPKRFPVEMDEVDIDASGVKMNGQADSFATVDQVKKTLGDDLYFGAVEVTNSKAAMNGKVDFQLSADFKDAVAEKK